LTVYMKCAICGDDIEYSEVHPYKICLNCLFIGPNEPGVYVIPKGSDLSISIHDRYFPIVPDEEIPKIFLEVFHDFSEYAKVMKEKYGRK
jgi:hypothetical protein